VRSTQLFLQNSASSSALGMHRDSYMNKVRLAATCFTLPYPRSLLRPRKNVIAVFDDWTLRVSQLGECVVAAVGVGDGAGNFAFGEAFDEIFR
jgi:hypothetical protein